MKGFGAALPVLALLFLAGASARLKQQTATFYTVQFSLVTAGACDDRHNQPVPIGFLNASRIDAANMIGRTAADISYRTPQGTFTNEATSTIGLPCKAVQVDGQAYASFKVWLRYEAEGTTLEQRTKLVYGGQIRGCEGRYNARTWTFTRQFMTGRRIAVANNATGALLAMRYVVPCAAPAPSPSPAPESPSPSPKPESPSPSPSPSPEPINCTAIKPGSDLVNGQCVCSTNPVPAINGNTEVICLPAQTTCPAPYTVPAKNRGNNIEACLTVGSPCPAALGLDFGLYSGNPSTLKECRPRDNSCQYVGFDMLIRDDANTPVGCVNSNDNACPFIAFREAPSYTLAACKQTSKCDVFVPTAWEKFTVPAKTLAGDLVACLTLPGDNACPALGALNFPIEFHKVDPGNCGNNITACSEQRTVECRPVGVACPQDLPLALYRFPAGTPTGNVTLAACRTGRSSCDLTRTGMNPAKDVNAANYGISIIENSRVLGCIESGATTCPAKFPMPVPTSGPITRCTYATPPQPVVCTANEIQCLNIDGTVNSCLRNDGSGCPAACPVTVRNNFGNKVQCLASSANTTCPAGYPLPFYADHTVNGVTTSLVTNCYRDADVPATCGVTTTDGLQPGTYDILIRATAAGPRLACQKTGSTLCPTAYPFTLLTVNNGVETLNECRLMEGQSCNSTAATFNIAGKDQGVLRACMTIVGPDCPKAFPAEVSDTVGATVKECLTQNSVCPLQRSFTLMDGDNLGKCISPVTLTATCSLPGYSGLEIFSNDGSSLVGCTATSDTKCPTRYSVGFYGDTIWVPGWVATLEACRAAVQGDCPTTGAEPLVYPIPSYNINGTIVACQKPNRGDICALSTTIPVRPVSAITDANGAVRPGPIETCIPNSLSSCSSDNINLSRVLQNRTLSLYTQSNGIATLAECNYFPPITNCSTITYFRITLASATGALQACLATPAGPMYCPTGATPKAWTFGLYMNGDLIECREGIPPLTVSQGCAAVPNAAAYPATVSYSGGASNPLLGCAGGVQCPTKVSLWGPNGTTVPDACQYMLQGGVCPAGYTVPVCNDTSVGVCTPTDAEDCVADNAIRCPGFVPSFLYDITAAAKSVKACALTATSCPATYAVPARKGSNASAPVAGCTNGNNATCTSWWAGFSSQPTWVCAE